MSELNVTESDSIPGFYEIDLVLHEDKRGSFREVYQKEKMEKLGLAVIEIVQQNVSFNRDKGVTRGYHAEPWDKYINVMHGKAFGAWVDLRKGPSFGKTHTTTLSVDKAVFVPKGVANSYQTLEPNTVYSYLVTEHWSPDGDYKAVSLFDEDIDIKWPIKLRLAIVSDKDHNNSSLDQTEPYNL